LGFFLLSLQFSKHKMKKIILYLAFLILLADLSNAQSIYFNKRISIPGGLETCRGIVRINNDYLIAGTFQSDYGTMVLYLSHLDSLANLKWTRNFITPGYFYYFGLSGALFQTMDKNYAICGGRVPAGPSGYSILIKVDSSGNKKWEKEYQLTDCSNCFYSGNITNDSGYILTGRAMIGGIRDEYLLLKTDSWGNQQWYQTYTDNDPRRNYAGLSVIQTPDNGYCMGGGGGYWYNPGVEFRGICEIIKTDSLGNQLWKKTYGNPNFYNGGGILCLSKDSCIVATYSLSTLFINIYEDYKQPYIVKLGLDGSEKWSRKITNVKSSNGATYIQPLNDDGFILSGSHRVQDTFYRNIGWLYKIKSNSDSIWYREYTFLTGSNDNQELRQVTQMPDKGFAAVGTMYSETGEQDAWLFKTDSLGCLVSGCDVGISEFNPNAGAQMLIYPNPFREAFAINYNIPKESKKGVFMLYDIYGKLIYQVGLNTSINQLQVVANKLVSGVYMASLVIDGIIVKSEKIIKE
jgi:hypothetical protein